MDDQFPLGPEDQQWLDRRLFAATLTHDLPAIDALITQGADPFAPVGPVELFASRSAWPARLALGSAAALSIQWPDVLERLLPEKMTSWPVVTQSADVLGLVSRCGAAVDLGHWAVEVSAMQGLKMLISRLDKSHPNAQACLRRLTISCLGGCSNTEAKDNVLNALVLCMAAEPELDRGWSHWRHFKLPSQTTDHQSMFMPMTFVMGTIANKNESHWPYHEEALSALRWALLHDEPVRSGDRCMGTVSEDTMLHMASTCARLDVLRVVLDAGCSLSARDAYGLTALEFAQKCKKFESVAFMESWLANRAFECAITERIETVFLEMV